MSTAFGSTRAGDPTSVIGRRIGAWLTEFGAIVAVSIVTFVALADSSETPSARDAEFACDVIQSAGDELCIDVGATIYVLDNLEAFWLVLLPHVLLWLAFSVLQGVTGGSPGKHLFGIRVINRSGEIIGIGRSLARTLLYAVDGFPWMIPMALGLIVAASTSNRQRIGDRVVESYVVHKRDLGVPIPIPEAPAPAPTG